MESTTREYAGSRIASGGNTNVTAGERDLTVTGSAITGRDVSLTAKGNVRLEAGENTSITTTENKFSSASIGASFTPQGLSNISVNANKANVNSKESLTAYSPTLVVAENNLSLTSGKDMDIIGSKAQGEKITAKVGGNLNIETLQEKETYEEQNSSMGFGISWGVKAKDKQTSTKSTGQANTASTESATNTPSASDNTVSSTGRKFFAPNIAGNWNKGNIDSHYRSARQQAGFFAGSGGFDIYVEKNTDLKGGIIASNAPSDKNHLSTGTFSFSDLKNEADYSASSFETGLTTTTKYKVENDELRPHNTLAITPIPGITISDNASTTTQSAIAPGTVIVRSGDSDALNKVLHSTENTLNSLDRIFSREDVKEQKELAETFSRLLNQEIGDFAQRMQERAKTPEERKKWAEGSINITLLRALGSGIAASFGGKDALSGATGSIAHDLFAKEIAKIPDDNLQLLATAFIAGATAKLLNRDAHTSAEAAVYAVHYNAHGHRRWFDGEVVYRDGKYYRYDKARDKEDEIEKPEEGMYIWKDDEDGSGNGQDYKIVSKKQNRTGFEQIDAIYDSVELTLDGTPVIGFSSNSSPTYIPTKPFQGKVIDRATKPIRQIILSPLSILADFGWKYSEFSKGFSTAVAEDFTPNFLSGAQMPTKNRNPYSFDTPYSLSGRIVGHGFSAIGGVVEFAAGVGTAAGGSVAAGSSVVAAPAVPAAAAAGATMATHGAITVGQASKNLADDLSRFNSSTSGNKVLKSTDKTPQGRTITDHAAERMNERGFSGRDIDNIIANNKKNRVKEVDENGQITWRYQDKRGNTVITDESGERIVTVYSHPKKINGGNYIPKE